VAISSLHSEVLLLELGGVFVDLGSVDPDAELTSLVLEFSDFVLTGTLGLDGDSLMEVKVLDERQLGADSHIEVGHGLVSLDLLSLQVLLVLQGETNLAKLEQNFEVGDELHHIGSSERVHDGLKEFALYLFDVLVDLVSNSLDEFLLEGRGVALLDGGGENKLALEEVGSLNSVGCGFLSSDELADLVEDLSGSGASRAGAKRHDFLDLLDGLLVAVLELLGLLLVHADQHNLHVADLVSLGSVVLLDVMHLFVKLVVSSLCFVLLVSDL